MITTARIYAQLSMSATESLSGKQSDGQRDLAQATGKRKELRANLELRANRASELTGDLKDAGDTSFLQDVGNFFTGSNPVGEVQEKQVANEANMEREQHELEIVKAEANDIFAELEKSQGDLQGTQSALKEILQDDQSTAQISILG